MMTEQRTEDHAEIELALTRDLLAAELARSADLEAQSDRLQAALASAVIGWWEQVNTLRRQNADLQGANTALLERARKAEVDLLEAEAEIERRDERDADLTLEMKDER